MASELHFQQLVDILRRRSRSIFFIAAIGTALAIAGGALMPPRYTAKAQIVMDRPQAGLLDRQGAPAGQAEDQSAVETLVTELSSRDHQQHVLDSLAKDPESQTATRLRQGFGATVDDLWRRLRDLLPQAWPTAAGPAAETLAPDRLVRDGVVVGLLGTAAGPAADTRSQPATARDPAAAASTDGAALSLDDLERRLNIYQERGSHVVSVSFTSTSAKAAAAVANRMVELFVARQGAQKRADAGRALAWLGEEVPGLKAEVEQAESAVRDYRVAHGLDYVNRTDVIEQELADLNRRLAAAQTDLVGRQARLAYLRDLRRRSAGTDAFVENLNTPALIDLRHQELALLQTEAQLDTTFGAKHPKTQLVASQLQELRRKIGEETDRAITGLKHEADVVGTQVQAIEGRRAALQAVSIGAREAEARLHELERRATVARERYERALQRQFEVRKQQEIVVPDVRILSLAVPPKRPSSPNPLLFVLPALIVSSILGCLLGIVMERLDRGLRGERDVNVALGIPCIGLVPHLRRMGRTRPHQTLLTRPFAAYSEAIRSVVAALQLEPPRFTRQVVLVSSSVAGEGKTTLAVSFAAYAALLGRRVLLVDLDFRHPGILRELGGTARRGVLDLLTHDHPPAEIVQRIPGFQLDYLPVRRCPADPLTLFAGEQMSRFLDQMRNNYDCVVVDSPPLLAVTEARLLASMVDKVIFVVKWGSTRRDVAQNALRLLGHLGEGRDDLVQAVVTQVDLKKHARYRYGDLAESFVKHQKYYKKYCVAAQRDPALTAVVPTKTLGTRT